MRHGIWRLARARSLSAPDGTSRAATRGQVLRRQSDRRDAARAAAGQSEPRRGACRSSAKSQSAGQAELELRPTAFLDDPGLLGPYCDFRSAIPRTDGRRTFNARTKPRNPHRSRPRPMSFGSYAAVFFGRLNPRTAGLPNLDLDVRPKVGRHLVRVHSIGSTLVASGCPTRDRILPVSVC